MVENVIWKQKYASVIFRICALFLGLKHMRLPKGETRYIAQESRPLQRSGKHDSKAKGQSR